MNFSRVQKIRSFITCSTCHLGFFDSASLWGNWGITKEGRRVLRSLISQTEQGQDSLTSCALIVAQLIPIYLWILFVPFHWCHRNILGLWILFDRMPTGFCEGQTEHSKSHGILPIHMKQCIWHDPVRYNTGLCSILSYSCSKQQIGQAPDKSQKQRPITEVTNSLSIHWSHPQLWLTHHVTCRNQIWHADPKLSDGQGSCCDDYSQPWAPRLQHNNVHMQDCFGEAVKMNARLKGLSCQSRAFLPTLHTKTVHFSKLKQKGTGQLCSSTCNAMIRDLVGPVAPQYGKLLVKWELCFQ